MHYASYSHTSSETKYRGRMIKKRQETCYHRVLALVRLAIGKCSPEYDGTEALYLDRYSLKQIDSSSFVPEL